MIELKGVVKHYDWGGYHFLPQLLQVQSTSKPMAELWFGDHASGSASLADGSLLSNWIALSPEIRLGRKSLHRFGSRLPFLLKVLDVQLPLSIQVHPNLVQAKMGYKKEIQKGLPSSLCNYKDDNHKPEVMLSLSDFYLLYGFRNVTECGGFLTRYSEMKPLAQILTSGGMKFLVSYLYQYPKDEIKNIIDSLICKYEQAFLQNELSKSEHMYWFMKCALNHKNQNIDYDVGLIIIFLLNLVYLPKGSAIFVPSGIPHAYLEGQNIEVMANSDNVIRAGLTLKHVDIEELFNITDFSHQDAHILEPIMLESQSVQEFPVPVEDFSLQEYSMRVNESIITPISDSACLWLVLYGEVKANNQQHYSSTGSVFYQRPGEINTITSQSQSILYRVCAKIEGEN